MAKKDGIAAFWKWWPTVSADIAKVFDGDGLPKDLVKQVSAHVAAIHPSLDWEFGPGKKSKHHLCLSSKGDHALRVIVERWLTGAPKANRTWEFYPARQPDPRPGILHIARRDVDLDDMTFAVTPDESRARIDVLMWHPVFDKLRTARKELMFIALDNLLGEDDVERWLGHVDVAQKRITKGISYRALGTYVRRFAKKAQRENFALLRGQTKKGKPVFVVTDTAIKPIDHAALEVHVEITLGITAPSEDGLPIKPESDALNAMEDELIARLGKHGVYIGHETLESKRVIHLHTASDGPAAKTIATWRKRYAKSRPIKVKAKRDPQWAILDRWH